MHWALLCCLRGLTFGTLGHVVLHETKHWTLGRRGKKEVQGHIHFWKGTAGLGELQSRNRCPVSLERGSGRRPDCRIGVRGWGWERLAQKHLLLHPGPQSFKWRRQVSTEKDAQLESGRLSFIWGKMRTAALETALQISLRDCSKEAVGEGQYIRFW